MTDEITVILDFKHNKMDSEILEMNTQTLYKQLYELEEVEKVKRLYPSNEQIDLNLKSGNQGRPQSGSLAIIFKKIKSSRILRTILQRLSGQSIELKVKIKGQKEVYLKSSNFSEKDVTKFINLLKDIK